MAATKLWEIRAALTATFTTALAGTGARVYDGVRPRGESPKKLLIVGMSSAFEETAVTGPSCRARQVPSTMGQEWRDELGEIDCVAGAWTGEKTTVNVRALVEEIVTSCEAVLNGDPQLAGLIQPSNNLVELSTLEVTEGRTGNGPYAQAMFTVSYGTLLT